ncbi:hypothetical protein PUN28_000748 [Cardiocondyla obscurior]|uniref:Uncharacterized protein n=1 Tax=Cardiocondyla obscurior TaxID=286306 RepID=A0AAW2H1D7_9HYME
MAVYREARNIRWNIAKGEERNNEEDEESIRHNSRSNIARKDGKGGRGRWCGTFVGNFIISGRQKASGARRVSIKRSLASIGLGLLKPEDL